MSVHSMTGFGRAEFSLGTSNGVLEIVSVNQKNLQIAVYGPAEWPTLEHTASAWIKAQLQRGKITARLNFTAASGTATTTWDTPATLQALQELQHLALQAKVPFTPSLETLLRLAESRRHNSANLPVLSEVEATLQATFQTALTQLVRMRQQEGQALAKDLRQRLQNLRQLTAGMAEHEKSAPARHLKLLHQRLQDAGLSLDLQDERLLKELALYADRCDITEEFVRLQSHFDQFERELVTPLGGRKLDFLVQELLREVNTIGSKAAEIATTRLVLEAKTEIERIREQVQNLE
jgi:uncharacterized protein (TIGR00255 family)